MADLLKQNSTAQPLVFLMTQSADHITPLTGASPTVTLSKSGSAFAGPAGAVSEISAGWYKVAGNATDTNTLGPLILHATAASGDPSDVEYAVVAFDPQSATAFVTSIPIDMTTALPANPSAGTVGESLFFALNRLGRRGTAQAGAASTITLDSGASATDNIYQTHGIRITSGTGSGQTATITGYVGSTKVATITRPGGGTWTTNPDNTSVFQIDANPLVSLGFILNTLLAETSGLIGAAFSKFFNKATPTGTVNSLPDAVAGASSGLALVGSNVGTATSVSGAVGSVTGNVGGNVVGSVGSVAGAVASVTGNVGGNVSGSVGSVTGNVGGNVSGSVGSVGTGGIVAASFAADAITASAIATDAIGSAELAASAVTEIQSGLATTTELDAVKAKTDNIPGSPAAIGSAMTLTAGERSSVADALLDRTDGVETSITPRQLYRLMMAVLAGKATETAGTVVFNRKDGTTAALTVQHDSTGSRTVVTIGTL